MRRVAGLILVFLLLGAIVNVAVAWGCSWRLPTSVEGAVIDMADWPDRSVPDWADSPVYSGARWYGFGIAETDVAFVHPRGARGDRWAHTYARSLDEFFDLISRSGPVGTARSLIHDHLRPTSMHVAAGWPLQSVQAWIPPGWALDQSSTSMVIPAPDGPVLVVFRVIGPHRLVRALPYGPIFPGFIINTLFYALLLWLLFLAPFAARRMIRRRRGLCDKCAYPIGVSPVCTECGGAVPRRADA